MKACILVRVEPGAERSVTEDLASSEGIEDAFPVLGRPEVVVRVEAPQLESLGGLVSRVSEMDGVLVSETLLEIPEGAVS